MHLRNALGFTLVELLTTLAISSLIIAFAVPSMEGLMNSANRKTVTSEIVAALNLARNTAIVKQTTVTVCGLDADGKCAAGWPEPITAFIDPTRQRQLTDDTQIVYVIPETERGMLTVRSGIHRHFQFSSRGWSRGTLGHFVWCPSSGDNTLATQVRINMGGRPKVAEDYDGDGIVEDAAGQPVSCPGNSSPS